MWLRERQQVLISISMVVMVGLFVLVKYLPIKKKLSRINIDQQAMSIAIDRAVTETTLLPKMREEIVLLEKGLGDFELNIPESRDLGSFLQTIAELMNEYDLLGQHIQPGQEIKDGELICIPVSMECRGGLEQIFEFCESIQNLDRVVRLEQFKLENDVKMAGQVRMHAQTVIYYRGERTGS